MWVGAYIDILVGSQGGFCQLRSLEIIMDLHNTLLTYRRKVDRPYIGIAIRSLLAGVYIGFGCLFMVLIRSCTALPPAISSLLSGLVFSIGLFLVCNADGELFTGNCLVLYHVLDKKIDILEAIKMLCINYLFNFVGITLVAWSAMAMRFYPDTALMIASSKFAFGQQVFFGAVFCNMLVCLAVGMNFKTTSKLDSLISLGFPVTMFVACGFEHSIADMFFVWFINYRIESLLWVIFSMLKITLGNLIGGGFIASLFWLSDQYML